MSDIEVVRPVPVEEIVAWFTCMAQAFLEPPDQSTETATSRAAAWDADRSWGARADGRWVATLRTMPRRITVPGSTIELATDALTNVTVAATHRRRGLLSTMLTESLQAAKDRGEAVSALIAAEWAIYGRYGYAPASEIADYTIAARRPGSRLLDETVAGSVRQVETAELAEIAPAVFEVARRERPGNIDREAFWWDREFGSNGVARADKRAPVHIVHEGRDGVDGYLTWYSTGGWSLAEPRAEITVRDLTAANPSAYRGLWQYLLGIDVVMKMQLQNRPVDEPLRWLLADGRAIQQDMRVDFMWLRVLDVPAALSARGYALEGTLVLEVDDRDGAGFAAGRYALEAGTDGAQCSPTTRAPDLKINQRALASVYLAGSSFTAQSYVGLVEELRPGALVRADAMFATPLAPWCATGF